MAVVWSDSVRKSWELGGLVELQAPQQTNSFFEVDRSIEVEASFLKDRIYEVEHKVLFRASFRATGFGDKNAENLAHDVQHKLSIGFAQHVSKWWALARKGPILQHVMVVFQERKRPRIHQQEHHTLGLVWILTCQSFLKKREVSALENWWCIEQCPPPTC